MGASSTSPFLLLAHHQHSFTPFDPVRAITSLLLPEGFPAHPHSGFSTLTVTLEGGLVNRDSEGLKMRYNNGDTQWMCAGRGTIHEEMWDTDPTAHGRIELFQLWVNSPARDKFCEPRVEHLLHQDTPVLTCPDTNVTATVICGEVTLAGLPMVIGPLGSAAHSPIAVMHVKIPPNQKLLVSAQCHSTFLAFVRRGSAVVNANAAGGAEAVVRMGDMLLFKCDNDNNNNVRQREYDDDLSRSSASEPERDKDEEQACGELRAGSAGLEALLLLGKPIDEPVVMQGPFVHASERDWRIAANAFNAPGLGENAYWSHRISDQEWMSHVQRTNLQGKLQEMLARMRMNTQVRDGL
jgi:redox-sensitive bicupin YhaK (pirin superfamily)